VRAGLKRESKGLEIVRREAFEAPNRGDVRKGVHSASIRHKKDSIRFVFFCSRVILRGVCWSGFVATDFIKRDIVISNQEKETSSFLSLLLASQHRFRKNKKVELSD
jgi:hypothetical protein